MDDYPDPHNDKILYAGWISFDEDGRLKAWNNQSGHFKPNSHDTELLIGLGFPADKYIDSKDNPYLE